MKYPTSAPAYLKGTPAAKTFNAAVRSINSGLRAASNPNAGKTGTPAAQLYQYHA